MLTHNSRAFGDVVLGAIRNSRASEASEGVTQKAKHHPILIYGAEREARVLRTHTEPLARSEGRTHREEERSSALRCTSGSLRTPGQGNAQRSWAWRALLCDSFDDSVFERSTEKVEILEDDLNTIKGLFLEILNGKQALPSQIQAVYKSYLCATEYEGYPKFAVIQAIDVRPSGSHRAFGEQMLLKELSVKTTCMKVLCSFIKLKTNRYPPLLAATHSATIGFQNGKTIQRFINDKLNLNIVDCTKDGGARSASSFVSLCRKRIASNTLSKAKVSMHIIDIDKCINHIFVAPSEGMVSLSALRFAPIFPFDPMPSRCRPS